MMKQLLVIGTIILAAGFILGSSQLMAITVYAQQSAAPQNMTTATNTTTVTNTTDSSRSSGDQCNNGYHN